MRTTQQVAKQMMDMMEYREFKESDGEIWVFKAEAIDGKSPEYYAMSEIVHNNHCGNYAYKWLHDCLEFLSEHEVDSSDDDDSMTEFIQGLVDIYTSDLTAWLAYDNRNIEFVNNALNDGITSQTTIDNLIARGQYEAIDTIMRSTINAILKLIQ